LALPSRPNERWSLDFVSDTFTDGRRFRALAVVDDCTRECLALVADTSLSGARVARELDAIIAVRGKPMTCVSDLRRETVEHPFGTIKARMGATHFQMRTLHRQNGGDTDQGRGIL
jgi:transposase InsO family protein